MSQVSRNKIVEYYKSNDERMDEYYFSHIKLLGLDKHPFGLDQNGTLRFEKIVGTSKVWQDYISYGNFEYGVGDYNRLSINFQKGKYTLEEFMQFYREDGCSLCHLIDVFSHEFYAIQDAEEFKKALDKLKNIEDLEEAKQDILDTLFLATIDSVEDELIFKYRKEAKKIINNNFGEGAWEEFINSLRDKKNAE